MTQPQPQPQMPPRLEDTWIRALAYPSESAALAAYEDVRDYIHGNPGVVASVSRAVTPEGQWLVAAVGVGALPTPALAAAFPPGTLMDVKEALSVALRQRAVDQWATMKPGGDFREMRGTHTMLGEALRVICRGCGGTPAVLYQRPMQAGVYGPHELGCLECTRTPARPGRGPWRGPASR